MAKVPLSEIYLADNGKAGLDILENNWIDIVLTDLNMPQMTGYEMIDKMCSRKDFCSIPIVVISTEGSTTRIDELKQKGVRGYLRKPFTPEMIREMMKQILGDWNG